MTIHCDRLMVFHAVAEYQSFTRAARYLECSKAWVSKEISALERETGSVLLHRNTRSLRLTMAGELLYTHTQRIARELEEARANLAGWQDKPQGLLRLTSPAGFADCVLAPLLPEFMAQFPDIRIDLQCTGALLNLVEEKIDVAIRLTHEPPPDRIARRLGTYGMVLCGASGYLATHPRLHHPGDLAEHPCLAYSTEKNFINWPFIAQGNAFTVPIRPKFSANSSRILLDALLSGHGIARLPDYTVAEHLASGALEQVLTDFYPPPIPVFTIYAQSRVIPARIRVFIEFLTQRYAGVVG